MGLFTPRPTQQRADLNLDLFLGPNSNGEGGDTAQSGSSFTLPAEWFPQSGVQLTWPHRQTDWASRLDDVTECYVRLAFEIATRELLLIVTPEAEAVERLLRERLPQRAVENIVFCPCPTDDTWARDHAFLSLVGPQGVRLLDFRFNAWGNKFRCILDNAINARIHAAGAVRGTYVDHLDLVLEGGSIESDGRGTLLTTAQCLLNPNRNPYLTKEQIEDRLKERLGVQRILWLHHGSLLGDDTDAHIDTLARFCSEDSIVYDTCDASDPNYDELRQMEEELRTFRTPDGKPYTLIPLPLPHPMADEEGNALPGTYANFLIMNSAVLYPTYGQADRDAEAAEVLKRAFPKMDIVGIDCKVLLFQHGSLHCATMQFPRSVLTK